MADENKDALGRDPNRARDFQKGFVGPNPLDAVKSAWLKMKQMVAPAPDNNAANPADEER